MCSNPMIYCTPYGIMEHIEPPYISNEHRSAHKRLAKDSAENIHHILARHMGGSNHANNKIKLYHYIHSALHTLFGNRDLIDKIEKLYHIEDTALEESLKIDLEKLIKKRKGKNIYLDECIK